MSPSTQNKLLLAAIGLLLCSSLAAVLARSEKDIWWVEQKLAERDLTFAAGAGFPARLVVLPRTANLAAVGAEMRHQPGNEDVSILLVSHAGAWLGVSPRFSSVVSIDTEHKITSDWAGRYLVRGDLSGAVRGLARGYLVAIKDAGFLREADLAPLPPANTSFNLPSLSFSWGFPLALALLLTHWYLLRRRSSRPVSAIAPRRESRKTVLGTAATLH